MKLPSRSLIMFVLLACEPICNPFNTLIFAAEVNAASDAWVPLFNGKNLQGWTIKLPSQPTNEDRRSNFRVEQGLLKIGDNRQPTRAAQPKYLFYKQPLSHYALHLEYRFAESADNSTRQHSGVMLHAQAPDTMQLKQKVPLALEVQLPQPTQSKRWHNLTVVVLGGGRVSYYVDGKRAVNQPQPRTTKTGIQSQQAGAAVKLQQGHIALQSTSHPIDFKQIRLINLAGCTNPNAKNYQPYFIKSDSASCLF